MGLFNKTRTDGQTYDGQGEDRQGLIDVVQYNGESDDILWRFPYDNLSTKTQLVVQEGQEALFLVGGQFADTMPSGTHTLSANNIPILQSLVNLPFGGNSPFKASVIYINTVTRVNEWGTNGLFSLYDNFYDEQVNVGAYGSCGLRITDSVAFVREYSGTLHLVTAFEFQEKFSSTISQYIKPAIIKAFDALQLSVMKMNAYLIEISEQVQKELNRYFEKYGITIVDFNIAAINADEDDPNYIAMLESQARKRKREREGYDYHTERQLDIMEGAAKNEGASGQMMGAGMGMGMGFGIGGAFGAQMGQMADVMNKQPQQQQQAAAVPPPPPSPVAYHVLINNVQQGPYDMATLAQMAQQGTLVRSTHVWKNGMPQWATAGECPDLASLFNTPPPPPAPPV